MPSSHRPGRFAARRHRLGGSILLASLLLGLGCREHPPARPHASPATRLETAPGEYVDTLADGAEIVLPQDGRIRGRLLGRDGAAPRATLHGPAGARHDLQAPAGAVLAVDLTLPAGTWRLAAPPGVSLAEGRGTEDRRRGRQVVLVVVDALRDDHLSVATTPQLLAALSGARRFADTRAEATWTLPSMTSLMTGRPALSLTAPDGALIGPPASVVTLAELYRQAGFATAAFVGNATLREVNGFGRGFAHFETPALTDPGKIDVAELVRRARGWLDDHRGEDCFLVVHAMETHEPLRDHAGAGRQVVSNQVLASRERPATAVEAQVFRDLYTLEAIHLDAPLAQFFTSLDADAIVAMTADHGEMLGEGGSWGHGMTVFDSVARVPLLVRAPGLAPGVDTRPASLLDVAPTLLAGAGVAVPAGLSGFDLARAVPADRRRSTSSFSAGPLRWTSTREGRTGLVHLVAQPGIGAQSAVRLLELHPLPAGVWECVPTCDGESQHLRPATGPLLTELAAAFATDVGQLTPGIQLLAVDRPATPPIELSAVSAELAAAYATAVPEAKIVDSRLQIRWPEAQPLALLVLPFTARPSPLGPGWQSGRDTPPAITGPGLYLWRNSRPPAIQHAQDEILGRLRALGYIR
ncbi:MAG: sulfatase [Holophagales bacterium]|nr:MAG: sulfatase [Holophagales bacterium]